MRLNVYQYQTPKGRKEQVTHWIAAPDEKTADAAARRRKWVPCGGVILRRHYGENEKHFRNKVGCDIVITKGREPDCPHGYDDPIRCSQCELVRNSALPALRDLVEVCEGVPVFQLDDGKASVKAVRLAGKFMKAINAAKAVIANADKAVS